jgi:ribosomal 50S subunit-associated protein YjgA (DUF615 family)
VSYTDGETHLVMKNEDVKTMLERIQKEESKTAAEKFYDKAIELVSKEHLTKEKAVVMVMEKYPELYIAFKKEKYAEEKGV